MSAVLLLIGKAVVEVWGFFWKDSINCSVISFSKHQIDLEVRDTVKGVWRLTSFYSCPERSRRRESWDLVRTLHAWEF